MTSWTGVDPGPGLFVFLSCVYLSVCLGFGGLVGWFVFLSRKNAGTFAVI